jgi:transcriptional regulator with XRE-family HTH domain
MSRTTSGCSPHARQGNLGRARRDARVRCCGTAFSLVERVITPTRAGSASLASVPHDADARGQLAEVGPLIRRLRRERGLSLRDLGRVTGFSISFLSLVERGHSSISLTSLHSVAVALGVEMNVFFPGPVTQPEPATVAHVSRRTGDPRLPIRGAHTYRLLGATGFERALEPLLVTIAPGETGDPRDDYAHEGEEFAFVLAGALVFSVDGVEHRLDAGDSIHYRSTVPHLVRNDGRQPAEVVWVLTPRLF